MYTREDELDETNLRIRLMAAEWLIAGILQERGVPKVLIDGWHHATPEVKADPNGILNGALKILHHFRDEATTRAQEIVVPDLDKGATS